MLKINRSLYCLRSNPDDLKVRVFSFQEQCRQLRATPIFQKRKAAFFEGVSDSGNDLNKFVQVVWRYLRTTASAYFHARADQIEIVVCPFALMDFNELPPFALALHEPLPIPPFACAENG